MNDQQPEPRQPVVVDARGLACPMPVVELAAAVEDHPVGTRFRLLATDTTAKVDIPVWCRLKRQKLVSAATDQGELIFIVEKIHEG
ncbi:MAG: sulfurtransferase TusA family protein [Nitriliruptorales bacterium]|nr:sulfurtransferase TusA family protein [Nitriliruptorales bacterium]